MNDHKQFEQMYKALGLRIEDVNSLIHDYKMSKKGQKGKDDPDLLEGGQPEQSELYEGGQREPMSKQKDDEDKKSDLGSDSDEINENQRQTTLEDFELLKHFITLIVEHNQKVLKQCSKKSGGGAFAATHNVNHEDQKIRQNLYSSQAQMTRSQTMLGQ